MQKWILAAIVLAGVSGAGCKPKADQNAAAEPDNAATRYAENLHRDVDRARATADKANERILQQNQQAKELADQP
jgi:hypothetical protein